MADGSHGSIHRHGLVNTHRYLCGARRGLAPHFLRGSKECQPETPLPRAISIASLRYLHNNHQGYSIDRYSAQVGLRGLVSQAVDRFGNHSSSFLNKQIAFLLLLESRTRNVHLKVSLLL